MKLIDKDALVERVDNLTDKGKYDNPYDCGFKDGINYAVCYIKEYLDTLKVKEVDLEKEYKDFLKCDGGRSMFETAKHFFELGLKAQKGE